MPYGRPGVYVNERLQSNPITSTGTANAAGAVLGAFPQGPSDKAYLVTSWYAFNQLFGGYNAAYPATFGVGQFFQNGGTSLYVRRAIDSAAVAASYTYTGTATITAKAAGADGNNLRTVFTQGALITGSTYYWTLSLYKETVAGTSSDITNDILLEVYNNLRFDLSTSSDYASTVVNGISNYITLSVLGSTAPSTSVVPLASGSDGSMPTAAQYVSAINDFDIIDRPLVVFAPEIISLLGSTNGLTVQQNLLSHFDGTNSFVVLDTPANLSPSAAVTYAGTIGTSSNSAVYYPNIYIGDPVGRTTTALRKVGPAGAVAGLYIATDKASGPFKAPAGISAKVVTANGVNATERNFTSTELDTMNSALTPVNPIRNIPGSGIVVMGARTLKQDNTASKYVNMRRSLNYIKKSLNDRTQFALFQNNNEVLWGQIRTTVSVFLNQYRSRGGLKGSTPAQAFYVKCDAENNTSTTIANGEVHIEIGVALQYPAEFVIINLSQITA